MLSLKEGQPIARFTEGKYKGKKTLNIINDDENEDKNNVNEIKFKEKILPVPNIEKRQVLYICGQSGCGKSTMAGEYMKIFKKIYPKLDIYIFSRKDSEPAFKKYDPIYIPIDEDLILNPIDITKELKKGALVVFDDYGTIQDNKLKNAVSKLLADILEVGRSYNIYCIVTSHLINSNDRKDTRIILNECDTLTIFPKACNKYATTYCLSKYFGIDKENINKIINLKSRWATIHKNYPMYVLYDKGAFIL